MNSRRRSGFTLLEAIVALAVVSIVCIGVLAAQGSALRAESIANARLPLAELARDRIAAVDMFDGSLNETPDTLKVGTFPPPYDMVQWHVRVEPVQGTTSLWSITAVTTSGADSVSLSSRRYRETASPSR